MAGRRNKSKFNLADSFNDLRADFRAGQDSRFVSRLSGVNAMGSGADYHYRVEARWLHMLERARHYQRNDQVVGQGIRRVVANIVQDGFRLDPQTGSEDLDEMIKMAWADWATDPDQCHSEGEMCFSEIEAVALSSVIADGDCFCLPLNTGKLQMVEAHRCRTPNGTKRNVVHGVMLDDNAVRQEYWFTREDLGLSQTLARVSDVMRYPARGPDGKRQVLHLYMPYRFSQRRGVTALAPVSDTVGMHDDVQFATLVKSQMAALIAILHERGPNWQPIGDQQKGDRTTESSGGYTKTIEGVSAGLEVFGDPDEKLSAFSPGIPSPEFFPHTMLLLTFIAINLDLPVQVLLLDPSKTNFSSWRGAIDQARLRFRQIQSWMVEKFHRPVYRWWIERLVATNPEIAQAAQADGVDVLAHRWNPPTFPYIEPLTDAQADQLQIEQALNSRRRIQASRGRDWDEVREEIIADNASLIRAAIIASMELKADFPAADVDWREVVCVPVADNVSASVPQGGKPAGQRPKPMAPPMEDDPAEDPEDDVEDETEDDPASWGGRLKNFNGAGKH